MVLYLLSGCGRWRYYLYILLKISNLKQEFNSEIDFAQGYVLPVDKPLGWTSYGVVGKVKYLIKKLGHKNVKVGHAGTLDPLATGVLLICLGKATKLADSLQAESKEYIATFCFGATTPSYDMEHEVDQTYPYEHITADALNEAVNSMIGEQLQTPPVYSAKQIDGKRAYEYARSGEQVEMRKALINIYSMEVLSFDLPKVTVKINCSKGTYIRSLARDLGEKLESGAYLTDLCRSRSGEYAVEDSYDMQTVEKILTETKQN